MKIYKNKENCKAAWMMTASAMDIIHELFIKNEDVNEETTNAFYELMKEINKWWDKIQNYPF